MADESEQPQAPQAPQQPEPPDYIPPDPTGKTDASWHPPAPITEIPLIPKSQRDTKE
jgi:hypothetical protein